MIMGCYLDWENIESEYFNDILLDKDMVCWFKHFCGDLLPCNIFSVAELNCYCSKYVLKEKLHN